MDMDIGIDMNTIMDQSREKNIRLFARILDPNLNGKKVFEAEQI